MKKFAVLALALALAAPGASASPEAEIIILTMLEKQAERGQDVINYITTEERLAMMPHGSNTPGVANPSGTFLYENVCVIESIEDKKQRNFGDSLKKSSPMDDSGDARGNSLENGEFAKKVFACGNDIPLTAYRILTPKEIEYRLMPDSEAPQAALGEEVSRAMDMIEDNDSQYQDGPLGKAFGDLSDSQKSQLLELGRGFGAGNVDPWADGLEIAGENYLDLVAFGTKAELLGTTDVHGRNAHILMARGMNKKQVTDDGEFTITDTLLAVDTETHVQLAMHVWGTIKQGRKTSPMTIVRWDEDYRPVAGSSLLIPFKSSMGLRMVMTDKKSQKELAEARKEYAKAKKELDSLKAQQAAGAFANIALGGMMDNMIKQLEQQMAMAELQMQGAEEDLKAAEVNVESMHRLFSGDSVVQVVSIKEAFVGDEIDYMNALGFNVDRNALAQNGAEKTLNDAIEQARRSAQDGGN